MIIRTVDWRTVKEKTMNRNIHIDAHASGRPLYHFWKTCVSAGRANEGLRASWLEHLERTVKECGFKYIRFHGLFHDDMSVYRIINGKEVYNWQYVDDLFDRLLDVGIRPFVELSFFPIDMKKDAKTTFWWKANVTPPDSFDKWEELISRTLGHWLDRYGLDEVRNWYFEVWNEPNLHGFWDGTKSKYFEMYEVIARRIKSIDPELRVGGPATSNFVPDDRFAGDLEDLEAHRTFQSDDIDLASWKPVWIDDFLEYCHERGLPVDFISTHPYPTDFALDLTGKLAGLTRSVDSTRNDLEHLRRLVDGSPYPKAQIHLTEWSSSPSPRDCSHDSLAAAAFIVKANLDSCHLVDSLSYWTFTDIIEEPGAGESIFHGGFGLVNIQGIVKPAYHAYRFLGSLGNEELHREEGCIVTRDSKDGSVRLLAYNYPMDEVPSTIPMSIHPDRSIIEATQRKGEEITLRIEISGILPGSAFLVETLDETHGNALRAWQNMGEPEPPTRQQTKLLKCVAMETKKTVVQADKDGLLLLTIVSEPWTITSIIQLL
jgi:xylan 1,4-beta-xylosidase